MITTTCLFSLMNIQMHRASRAVFLGPGNLRCGYIVPRPASVLWHGLPDCASAASVPMRAGSVCRCSISHMKTKAQSAPVERLSVSTFTIPTDHPESDGTLTWNKTTLVLVEVAAGRETGLGYTYADAATAALIHDPLKDVVVGSDALSPNAVYMEMWRKIRNLGRPGICSMAIAAVDCALWDLKARLLGVPLVTLLGQVRDAAPIYGSG